MYEMDREILKRKLDAILLIRAKVKGTSYKEEYLAFSKELREKVELSRKSAEKVNSQEVLTTRDYEIDPNQDLDKQLGVVLEGEM